MIIENFKWHLEAFASELFKYTIYIYTQLNYTQILFINISVNDSIL